ncbi:hypothetical protein LIER_40029 [Lithospermum erythrorhizon]|uniref:DUF4283 domain-containing protein n=1 Tax=Lithospermum erythrorhizon TaxID=34254 RepID=A0AAV3QS01_LITER
MRKKKKRKCPPAEEDASMLVASNADPSLLVRVPNDNRVNVDNVLDENLQNVVAEWGRNSPSHPADGSSVRYVVALSSENGVVPQCEHGDVTQDLSQIPIAARVSQPQIVGGSIVGCLVAPQSAIDVQIAPQTVSDAAVNTGTGVVVQGKDGDKNDTAPVFCPCDEPGSSSGGPNKSPLVVEGLVFKAGGSGRSSRAVPVSVLVLVLLPTAPNPPTTRPIRPEAAVPGIVPTGPPEGAKVRPKFSEVIKDNRIVGNGLQLQQYDFLENDDDVILDESDEIPFVETWGYCLIGCFTGPFPGRQALNSVVKSWNVKCLSFRMLRVGLCLVDAGVILGDDLFTSVPTWVLFPDVLLSVWSESGLSKIASKVGIPMYTDKVTKDRTKMSYALSN